MRLIRSVIFDLDGTLYDERGGMRRAVAETVRAAAEWMPGLDAERAATLYPEVGRAVWERAELLGPQNPGGATTLQLREQVWTALLEDMGCDGASATAGPRLARIYTQLRKEGHRLFDESLGVLSALEALVRSGRLERVAMITNGPSDLQREKLGACGLGAAFEPLVISAEIGTVKPDPRIFLGAVSGCGCDPGEALYVGDNPALDIGGAIGAGLLAAWVNRTGETFPGHLPPPDHEMAELTPLLSIVDGRA